MKSSDPSPQAFKFAYDVRPLIEEYRTEVHVQDVAMDSRGNFTAFVLAEAGFRDVKHFVVRFQPSGAMDSAFGSGGAVELKHPRVHSCGSGTLNYGRIHLRRDDSVLLDCGGLFFSVSSDGRPESDFGIAGAVELEPGTAARTQSDGPQEIAAVELLRDGGFVAGGAFGSYEGNPFGMYVAKFDRNGRTDESFGKKGRAIYTFDPQLPTDRFSRATGRLVHLRVNPDESVIGAAVALQEGRDTRDDWHPRYTNSLVMLGLNFQGNVHPGYATFRMPLAGGPGVQIGAKRVEGFEQKRSFWCDRDCSRAKVDGEKTLIHGMFWNSGWAALVEDKNLKAQTVLDRGKEIGIAVGAYSMIREFWGGDFLWLSETEKALVLQRRDGSGKLRQVAEGKDLLEVPHAYKDGPRKNSFSKDGKILLRWQAYSSHEEKREHTLHIRVIEF